MDRKSVAVLGTLDTKGAEALYVKETVERLGQPTLLIDTGVQGEAAAPADIRRRSSPWSTRSACPLEPPANGTPWCDTPPGGLSCRVGRQALLPAPSPIRRPP